MHDEDCLNIIHRRRTLSGDSRIRHLWLLLLLLITLQSLEKVKLSFPVKEIMNFHLIVKFQPKAEYPQLLVGILWVYVSCTD